MRWMIYGATGFTGRLVIEAALERGHYPIIAGRNPDTLRELCRTYDLEFAAFKLDDIATIAEAIADLDVVYHAAGPFVHTSDPMIKACLATNTHYLDITGEINVFENTFQYDDVARKNGVALISGVGFDVLATDCLALYVAQQITGAKTLEIGLTGFAMSSGTTKSMLEMLPQGGMTRENGDIVSVPLGHKTRSIPLPDGAQSAIAIPWGDLITSYRTTGIPNITTYMTLPQPIIMLTKLTAPISTRITRVGMAKKALERALDLFVTAPNAEERGAATASVWARASNDSGQSAQAWLETPEPYYFTAQIAVDVVERTIEVHPIGALSPAQAFGADFVLAVDGTKRLDMLP